MRRAARTLVALGAASLVGCGAVLGFDEISYDAADGATIADQDADAEGDAISIDEASTFDASSADVVVDPGDGGADAGGCTNLILNAGFEQTATCDPWIFYGGTEAGVATPPNSGSYACRACVDVGAINTLATLPGLTVAPGDTVHFEVWVRAENGALFAHPITVIARGDHDLTEKSYTLSDVYQRMTVDHLVTVDGGAQALSVQMLAGVNAPDGGACILFDDVRVCVSHDGG